MRFGCAATRPRARAAPRSGSTRRALAPSRQTRRRPIARPHSTVAAPREVALGRCTGRGLPPPGRLLVCSRHTRRRGLAGRGGPSRPHGGRSWTGRGRVRVACHDGTATRPARPSSPRPSLAALRRRPRHASRSPSWSEGGGRALGTSAGDREGRRQRSAHGVKRGRAPDPPRLSWSSRGSCRRLRREQWDRRGWSLARSCTHLLSSRARRRRCRTRLLRRLASDPSRPCSARARSARTSATAACTWDSACGTHGGTAPTLPSCYVQAAPGVGARTPGVGARTPGVGARTPGVGARTPGVGTQSAHARRVARGRPTFWHTNVSRRNPEATARNERADDHWS